MFKAWCLRVQTHVFVVPKPDFFFFYLTASDEEGTCLQDEQQESCIINILQ